MPLYIVEAAFYLEATCQLCDGCTDIAVLRGIALSVSDLKRMQLLPPHTSKFVHSVQGLMCQQSSHSCSLCYVIWGCAMYLCGAAVNRDAMPCYAGHCAGWILRLHLQAGAVLGVFF